MGEYKSLKTIVPVDYQGNPICQVNLSCKTTVGKLILSIISLTGQEADGNYSVSIKIGPYSMYSIDIADHWYTSLIDLGVLGYLDCNNEMIKNHSNLTDRTNIWKVIEQGIIEVFSISLRTKFKAKHSYIKLSKGKLLGSEHIHSN